MLKSGDTLGKANNDKDVGRMSVPCPMESYGILPGAGLAGHPDHAEDHKKRREWL